MGDRQVLVDLIAPAVGGDAEDFTDTLLHAFGGLANVFAASSRDIRARTSAGVADRIECAALLLNRLTRQRVENGPIVDNWCAFVDYLRLSLASEPYEQVRVLYLDHAGRLILDEAHSRGSSTSAPVSTLGILRRVIQLGARGFFVVHNHPCGDARPSHDDRTITRALNEGARSIGVCMYDHIVIGRATCYSIMQDRPIAFPAAPG